MGRPSGPVAFPLFTFFNASLSPSTLRFSFFVKVGLVFTLIPLFIVFCKSHVCFSRTHLIFPIFPIRVNFCRGHSTIAFHQSRLEATSSLVVIALYPHFNKKEALNAYLGFYRDVTALAAPPQLFIIYFEFIFSMIIPPFIYASNASHLIKVLVWSEFREKYSHILSLRI